jgi:hypothetical protein
MLDLSLSKSDVLSFFLYGVGDDIISFLEQSTTSSAFEQSRSPYPNLTYQGIPSTSSD